MSRMQRTKGKVGEREWAAKLREHGFESARRGVQTACRGGLTAPDVICDELAIHWEVKRTEKPNLPAAYAQAAQDAAVDREPVVATRKNSGAWMIYCAGGHYLGLHQKISRLETELKQARAGGT